MSVLGHVAIGVATARRITPAGDQGKLSWRMAVFSMLALLPDIDLALGAVARSMPLLDHRGATHSIAVAVGVGGAIALVIRVQGRQNAAAWGIVACALVASHGLLDSLGDSDLGVALLWPFSDVRLLAPWHPLPNPSLPGMFSSSGLATLAIEFLVLLPFWLYAFLPRRSAALQVQS